MRKNIKLIKGFKDITKGTHRHTHTHCMPHTKETDLHFKSIKAYPKIVPVAHKDFQMQRGK